MIVSISISSQLSRAVCFLLCGLTRGLHEARGTRLCQCLPIQYTYSLDRFLSERPGGANLGALPCNLLSLSVPIHLCDIPTSPHRKVSAFLEEIKVSLPPEYCSPGRSSYINWNCGGLIRLGGILPVALLTAACHHDGDCMPAHDRCGQILQQGTDC